MENLLTSSGRHLGKATVLVVTGLWLPAEWDPSYLWTNPPFHLRELSSRPTRVLVSTSMLFARINISETARGSVVLIVMVIQIILGLD